MKLRSNRTIQHNPGLFDSLNTSVSSTELCSDEEDSDHFTTNSSLEDVEKMCDELRGLISDQSIPLTNISLNNRNMNITIQNHNIEDIDEEDSIADDFEQLDPVANSSKKINFIYGEELDDYISEEDSDYNPTTELLNKSNDNDIKCVSKFFAFSEDDKKYFRILSKEDKDSILKLKDAINQNSLVNKPVIFRILECKLPLNSKMEIIKRYKESKMLDKTSTEFYKVQEYINGILSIPFNKYNDLHIENTAEYILKSKKTLDSIIYGHEKVKIHRNFGCSAQNQENVFGIYGPRKNHH